MSVNGNELSNPERGMERRNPEQGQPPLDKRQQEREERERKEQEAAAAKAEAKAVRERVNGARTLEPSVEELHWRERWIAGRDAAIDAFERAEGTTRERVIAARSIVASAAAGCRDCFERGRDAAARAIEGAKA